jgi:hypothetical protein
MYGNQDRSL